MDLVEYSARYFGVKSTKHVLLVPSVFLDRDDEDKKSHIISKKSEQKQLEQCSLLLKIFLKIIPGHNQCFLHQKRNGCNFRTCPGC